MSNKSEFVRRWRLKTKERIVEAMGGKCCICEYKKCQSALELHHVNPEEKEMGMGAIRANPISWEKIVIELRKCVLVCSNCHREIHDGVTKIPEDAPKFNEEYKEYEKAFKKKMDKCPICGKLKSTANITCSSTCAAKKTRKINWDVIDLLELKKTKSNVKIADELGCSEMAIRKRLKKIS